MITMIGIQFAVYEFMKRSLVGLPPPKKEKELKEAQLKVSAIISSRTFMLGTFFSHYLVELFTT